MYHLRFLSLFILLFFSCHRKQDTTPLKFDKTKWLIQEEKKYPYRNRMLKDLLDHQKLHGLKKAQVIDLLGQPNRTDTGYLFYTVDQKFFANTTFPLHVKTLVIKFGKDSLVEWRKIHE